MGKIRETKRGSDRPMFLSRALQAGTESIFKQKARRARGRRPGRAVV